jgi:pimeloyl-[acyl-carrier protein] methyl ester esterase
MSLHIEIIGQGRGEVKDLVLLHGWGMHGGVWNPVKESLAERFRLHIVDLPGFGFSQPIEPYDLRHLVQAIAPQVPENIALCGWSLGGQVALQWALDRPQQIEKLLLASTTPRFIQEAVWDAGISLETFRQFAEGIQSDYQPEMTRFLSLQAQGGEAALDTLRELKRHFFQRPAPSAHSLQAGLDILLESDFRTHVKTISTTTCVIHGGRDRVVPIAAGEWLAASLPSAQMHRHENASHAPFLSHPEWFVRILSGFLQ